MVEPRHGVQPQQPQPGHAQVNAFHGGVAESGWAERAAVADTVTQDAPGVAEIAAILPAHAGHLPIVVRLGESDPEGNPADAGSVLVRRLHRHNHPKFASSRIAARSCSTGTVGLYSKATEPRKRSPWS